jgi:hypothetical protein
VELSEALAIEHLAHARIECGVYRVELAAEEPARELAAAQTRVDRDSDIFPSACRGASLHEPDADGDRE